MDEQQFIDKYWHANTEVVTVTNPTKDDYVFQATVDAQIDPVTRRPRPEARQYRVPAGGTERFPGFIANMYLDQMSRQLAQTDDRLDRMIDYAERAKYYDQLIVDTVDLIAAYNPNPAFADDNHEAVDDAPAEVPFAAALAEKPAPGTGKHFESKVAAKP